MIKLLHAADLHLDSPFSHLPLEEAAQRRQAQRACLSVLPLLCQREQCDLVLLAGDLFDTRQIYRDTLDALMEALADCRVPVFIAPGNHDPMGPDSPYAKAQWPDNVHIFTSTTIKTVDMGEYTVSGAAFVGADKPSLAGYTAPRDERPHLMVLHGEVSSAAGEYRTGTPMQAAASRLRYLALGHIHQRGARRTVNGTTYAWPGCMMGRGFDELGPKGLYLVEIDQGAVRLQFQQLEVPRYEIWEVPVPELAGLRERMADAGRHHYRIVLTGTGPAPDTKGLERELLPLAASLQWEDQTTAPLRTVTAQEDSLAGLFVRELEKVPAETPADQDLLALAKTLGLQALEGREVTLS